MFKRIAFLLAAVLLISSLFTACTPPDDGSVTPPINTDKEGDTMKKEYVPAGKYFEKYAEEDRKIINKDTLASYAATNDKYLKTTPKAIVIDFPTFGDQTMDYFDDYFVTAALQGIAVARVYTGPYNWGDVGAVRYTDLVVEAMRDYYGLDQTAPVIVKGSGMGATAALNYCADTRHTITACAVAFPCTDIERSFECRRDYPRTFVRSLYNYTNSFEEAISFISPTERVEYMPDIKYFITGGTADQLFEYRTLERYISLLEKRDLDVVSDIIHGADHGQMGDITQEKLENFIKKYADTKVEVKETIPVDNKESVSAQNYTEIYSEFAEDDAKFINFEDISYYARTNLKYIKGDIKGIIVEFPGLGGSSCLGGRVEMEVSDNEYNNDYALSLAEEGIAILYMYCGPWSWGNRGVIRMADLVVDAVLKQYSLSSDTPIVSTGGSMGGLGALMYTIDSRQNIVGCMAACPCFDVITAYDATASFPRTFLSAIASYDMPFNEALKKISAIERLDEMPKVPYYIVCNVEDDVFDDEGMAAFVELMKGKGQDVTFKVLPGTKHGEFTPEETISYRAFIRNLIVGE